MKYLTMAALITSLYFVTGCTDNEKIKQEIWQRQTECHKSSEIYYKEKGYTYPDKIYSSYSLKDNKCYLLVASINDIISANIRSISTDILLIDSQTNMQLKELIHKINIDLHSKTTDEYSYYEYGVGIRSEITEKEYNDIHKQMFDIIK